MQSAHTCRNCSMDGSGATEINGLRVPKSSADGCRAAATCALNAPLCQGSVLVNVGEDSVELVEAVVADYQLALTGRRMLDRDPGAQLFGQLLLQAVDVRITRGLFRCLACRRPLHAAHE